MRNPNFGRGAFARNKNDAKDRKVDKCLLHFLSDRTWLIKSYFIFIKELKNLERNW